MTSVLAGTKLGRAPRSAVCGVMRLMLYGVESGAIVAPTLLERHRNACLVCQASAVRQRRLLRGLASLRQQLEPLPYEMTVVLGHPLSVTTRSLSAARKACTRSVAAATASVASVVAIGVVVLAGRRMRSLAGSR